MDLQCPWSVTTCSRITASHLQVSHWKDDVILVGDSLQSAFIYTVNLSGCRAVSADLSVGKDSTTLAYSYYVIDLQCLARNSAAGGKVHLMAWSQTSERLAITFQPDDSSESELILVIATSRAHADANRIKFTPLGFIRGNFDASNLN
jgi:hypothetical protein